MRRGAVVAAGLGMALPLFVRGPDLRADAAHALAILLAALALNLSMGFAGQPSLGQGAFMGIGAFGYAILRARAGAGPMTSLALAVAVGCIAGWIVARGVARLRSPFVALSTWVVAWTFWLSLGSFPSLTGGTSGLVVGPAHINMRLLGVSFTLGTVGLYEIALAAVAVTMLGTAGILRRWGPALAAQREDAAAARAAGIDVDKLRTVALVFSAGIAAFAGVLVAQVAAVADPTTFRPVLSIVLFLAVLVGGAGSLLGPVAGVFAILAVSSSTSALSRALDVSPGRLEPLAAAVLLALVIAVGRGGVAAVVQDVLRVRRGSVPPAEPESLVRPVSGGRIEAREIHVSFGGLRALDGVSFSAAAGSCHALIGPNGCGKTTLLRVMSGALEQDQGTVLLDGRPLDGLPPHRRAAAGLIRTQQRLALPPRIRTIDHVLSGMEPARTTGFLQALTRTPRARSEERIFERRAHAALQALDLDDLAAHSSEELSFGRRRLVQVARATASQPRVLLLDEPSAGLDHAETSLLVELVGRIREAGITVVLVAHDLGLVRALADRVTVLDAGVVIAEGTPEEVAANPQVRAAYLGG